MLGCFFITSQALWILLWWELLSFRAAHRLLVLGADMGLAPSSSPGDSQIHTLLISSLIKLHPASQLLIFHLACQIEAPGTVRSRRLFFCFSIILAKEISELPFSLPHFPYSWISVWLPFSSRLLPSADEVLLLLCVTLRCSYWKVKLMSKEMISLFSEVLTDCHFQRVLSLAL